MVEFGDSIECGLSNPEKYFSTKTFQANSGHANRLKPFGNLKKYIFEDGCMEIFCLDLIREVNNDPDALAPVIATIAEEVRSKTLRGVSHETHREDFENHMAIFNKKNSAQRILYAQDSLTKACNSLSYLIDSTFFVKFFCDKFQTVIDWEKRKEQKRLNDPQYTALPHYCKILTAMDFIHGPKGVLTLNKNYLEKSEINKRQDWLNDLKFIRQFMLTSKCLSESDAPESYTRFI